MRRGKFSGHTWLQQTPLKTNRFPSFPRRTCLTFLGCHSFFFRHFSVGGLEIYGKSVYVALLYFYFLFSKGGRDCRPHLLLPCPAPHSQSPLFFPFWQVLPPSWEISPFLTLSLLHRPQKYFSAVDFLLGGGIWAAPSLLPIVLLLLLLLFPISGMLITSDSIQNVGKERKGLLFSRYGISQTNELCFLKRVNYRQ